MTAAIPAAGILTDTPEMATAVPARRGYSWPPFADKPDKPLIGASSLDNVLNQGWLGGWKVKLAAEAAADARAELAGLNKRDAVQIVKARARDAANKAAEDGGTCHGWIAAALADHPHPGLPDHLTHIGDVARDWVQRYEPNPVLIERTLYAPDLGVAGTVDLVSDGLTLPDGRRLDGWWAVDWKTKVGKHLSKVEPKLGNAMQACALAQATHVAIPEQEALYELPPLAGFVLVYLADDGHRTQPVKVDSSALQALVRFAVGVIEHERSLGMAIFGPPLQQHVGPTGVNQLQMNPNGDKENTHVVA